MYFVVSFVVGLALNVAIVLMCLFIGVDRQFIVPLVIANMVVQVVELALHRRDSE